MSQRARLSFAGHSGLAEEVQRGHHTERCDTRGEKEREPVARYQRLSSGEITTGQGGGADSREGEKGGQSQRRSHLRGGVHETGGQSTFPPLHRRRSTSSRSDRSATQTKTGKCRANEHIGHSTFGGDARCDEGGRRHHYEPQGHSCSAAQKARNSAA